MKSLDRRDFIEKLFGGIAGTSLLLESTKQDIFQKIKPLVSVSTKEPDEEYWQFVKGHFSIEDGLTYVNNASLGPSPEIVIDATEKFRRKVESFPSHYIFGGLNDEKERVRKNAAALLGVSSEEIAIIHNTTEGMNVIASSFPLKAGDEVILADHEHPSGTIPWKYWKETKGIKLVRPVLPILPSNKEEIVDIYRKAITPRTKIISMCHIVNTNGMVLPIKEVTELAHSRGIQVAVDGAQSCGMFRFDLKEIGCDFYVTSAHKWLMAPKGTGLFYVKKEFQNVLNPLIVASGYQTKTIKRFENYNTRNLPEVMGLGAALDFHNLIGPAKKEARIFELKKYFRDQLSALDFVKIKTPAPDDLSAGITVVEIVGKDVRKAAAALLEKFRIGCRPMYTYNLNALRISLSVFNTKNDVDYVVSSIKEVHKTN